MFNISIRISRIKFITSNWQISNSELRLILSSHTRLRFENKTRRTIDLDAYSWMLTTACQQLTEMVNMISHKKKQLSPEEYSVRKKAGEQTMQTVFSGCFKNRFRLDCVPSQPIISESIKILWEIKQIFEHRRCTDRCNRMGVVTSLKSTLYKCSSHRNSNSVFSSGKLVCIHV